MNYFAYTRAIFSDKRLLEKGGILVGLCVVIWIVSFVSNFATSYVTEMTRAMQDSTILELINAMSAIAAYLIILPISLYVMGYMFRIADAIRTKSKTALPEHSDIKKTYQFSLVHLVVSVAMMTPLYMVLSLFFVMLFYIGDLSGLLSQTQASHMWLITAIIILVIILLALLMAVVVFTGSSTLVYLYAKKGSFMKIFSFRDFSAVFSYAWKHFLVFGGFLMFFGLVTGVAVLILCCIGWLISPFIYAAWILLSGAVLGAIWENIDKNVKLKG